VSFNHYYQSELSALRELGRRFSERNPGLAPFLAQPGRDPDVERLLEGFAFLTGRLRQKLDDELPELTHSLMNLLWPNYMRPQPGFSMLQFEPLSAGKTGVSVPRDASVESVKVEGVGCKFRTCYETQVLPLKLSAVDYSAQGSGAYLSLKLTINGDGNIGDLALSTLRLHLCGEPYVSQALYLALLQHLDELVVKVLDDTGQPLHGDNHQPLTLKLSTDEVTPVGFAEDEALIPYPLNTFRGYRHLQEYFAYPDKFLFVDIGGLDMLKHLPKEQLQRARGLRIECVLRKSGIQRQQPGLENIKLYCTPLVNLFKHPAYPLSIEGKRDEYLLSPFQMERDRCAVFSIDKVSGCLTGQTSGRPYVPFESFEHDSSLGGVSETPHYSVRQRSSSVHEGMDTYLSFAGSSDGGPPEIVSIELSCTNQNLPLQLGIGDIKLACDNMPVSLNFSNITTVTAGYPPPLGHDFLWKVISNMSLNYLSLANVEALRVILQTYDLPGYYDDHARNVSEKLLKGLQSISHQPVDRLFRGLPVRGICTELTINPKGYMGEGQVFLFGSVLNEFFALYTSLNSFHELHVKSTQGERYQWKPRMGLQPLL
jgi:type VI secretion system protein ImpG